MWRDLAVPEEPLRRCRVAFRHSNRSLKWRGITRANSRTRTKRKPKAKIRDFKTKQEGEPDENAKGGVAGSGTSRSDDRSAAAPEDPALIAIHVPHHCEIIKFLVGVIQTCSTWVLRRPLAIVALMVLMACVGPYHPKNFSFLASSASVASKNFSSSSLPARADDGHPANRLQTANGRARQQLSRPFLSPFCWSEELEHSDWFAAEN